MNIRIVDAPAHPCPLCGKVVPYERPMNPLYAMGQDFDKEPVYGYQPGFAHPVLHDCVQQGPWAAEKP